MHLSPWWLRMLSVLRRWFCCWSVFFVCASHWLWGLFCCALLCVHSSFAIILKMKRELVALLLLSYGCLVTVNDSSSRCGRLVCGVWLWYFLIIHTYFLGFCWGVCKGEWVVVIVMACSLSGQPSWSNSANMKMITRPKLKHLDFVFAVHKADIQKKQFT